MLCKIDATIGTTDEKARAINFLRAIQAIATAAAGSTPSVTPLTAPSTLGTGNVITSVISNTEAGGWTSSSSTTLTNAYSATSATPYLLDLYSTANTDTGKTTYPYLKASFYTNRAYPFSGSGSASWANTTYLSNQSIDVTVGFHTGTAADGNYLGTNTVDGAWSRNLTCGGNLTGGAAYTSQTLASNTSKQIRAAAGEHLVAATSQYIIVMSRYGMVYLGLRNSVAWENAYADNPLVTGFYSDFSNGNATAGGLNQMDMLTSWMYTVDSSGIASGPSWRTHKSYTVSGVNPISGTPDNAFYAAALWGGYSSATYGGGYMPLMPFGLRSHNYTTAVGPVNDSNGALVPPAYPISPVYTSSGNAVNQAGAIKGMYRSLSGSDTFMNNYYSAGQTFTIGTDSFYPYAVGDDTLYRDLFLIRKA
jgi:hypothetical protein